jgi:hypothetical protein
LSVISPRTKRGRWILTVGHHAHELGPGRREIDGWRHLMPTASPLHEIAMMIAISDERGMFLSPADSARIRA